MKKNIYVKNNSKSKEGSGLRKIVFIALLGLILTLLICACIKMAWDSDRDAVVLYVNKFPVTMSEFKKSMDNNKAWVYSYFKGKNVDVGTSAFWETDIDGEKPINMLKEKSKGDIISIKIQQIIAKDKGVIKDIDYGKILGNLKKFNSDRLRAVKNKKIVYGPVQYTEDIYYDKIVSDMISGVKNKILEKKEFKEQELKKYYEDEKENKFKKYSAIKISRISIEYDINSEEMKKSAFEEANDLLREIRQGIDIDNAIKKYKNTAGIRLSISEQLFDEKTNKMDAMRWPRLLAEAEKLEPEEVGNIIELQDSFNIIQCLEKSRPQYKSFDEVKAIIKDNLVQEEYASLVEKYKAEAHIELVENEYKKIKVQ